MEAPMGVPEGVAQTAAPAPVGEGAQNVAKTADAAHISNLIHQSLQAGAGRAAKLKPSMYGHIKDAPKAETKLREIAMKSLGGGHPALSGGIGKVVLSSAEKVAAMRFQVALTKQAFNPLQAAKNIGQLGIHAAKANPGAAMVAGGALAGAGIGAAAGGPGNRLQGALTGGLAGGAIGAGGAFAKSKGLIGGPKDVTQFARSVPPPAPSSLKAMQRTYPAPPRPNPNAAPSLPMLHPPSQADLLKAAAAMKFQLALLAAA
jgi:hypothetical protein